MKNPPFSAVGSASRRDSAYPATRHSRPGRGIKPLLQALSVLLAPALPATTPTKSDWNVTDHLPLEKIIVQGHRGVGVLGVMSFATDYPDVTLREIKAYYAARKKP
jgi:hypothetical protein